MVPRLRARPEQADAAPPPEDPVDEPKVKVHIVDVSELGEVRDVNVDYRDANAQAKDLGLDENLDQIVDPATGHGHFVKSILDRYSGLDAKLWEVGSPLGEIDDEALIATLKKAVEYDDEGMVHRVLNLSLSGYTENDTPSFVLADQIKAMIDEGWLIVAAAGNAASCRLSWPAALPNVVAVGAVDECQHPAWFSNYGSWVDASALGVDVVAEFPKLSDVDPELEVDGDLKSTDFHTDWARWSGTSFSAPLVAARLAAHLQSTAGATNADAIDAVLKGEDVQRLPFHGAIVK